MAISVEEARAMTEEQLQETITEIAFEIIANVGTARGMYIEAIQLSPFLAATSRHVLPM